MGWHENHPHCGDHGASGDNSSPIPKLFISAYIYRSRKNVAGTVDSQSVILSVSEESSPLCCLEDSSLRFAQNDRKASLRSEQHTVNFSDSLARTLAIAVSHGRAMHAPTIFSTLFCRSPSGHSPPGRLLVVGILVAP